jgi:hypothetical protein
VTLGPQAEYVEWCVVVLGEELLVTIGDRHFMVPRRCIAYHGITGVGLLSGTSGHREVVPR